METGFLHHSLHYAVLLLFLECVTVPFFLHQSGKRSLSLIVGFPISFYYFCYYFYYYYDNYYYYC